MFPRAFLVALALLVSATAVQAQNRPDRARFLRWAYQDAVDLVEEADWQTPLYALGAAAVLVPVTSFDGDINPEVQKVYRGPFGDYLNFANQLGGPKVTLPVVGVFAASLATGDTRFQDAAFTSLQALAYANTINYTLKYTIGRVRPAGPGGALEFEPFSGNNSFPSGHTATAFAVITPWVLYYPGPATYGLFALCTGTAVARLARDRHWTTDVVAGGTIGFLTAYWLTKQHQGEAARLTVIPLAGRDAAGLVLQMRL
jgi:membrane-associated phospholipid phosphatase